MPHLTYPEPGYSQTGYCDNYISRCLNVRVYTYNIRQYYFTLWLHPKFGQNPVGIPYMVDVSPCWNYASFYISSHPPNLVLDKSPVPANTVQNAINPQWLSRFYNNYNSQCPIIRLVLMTTTGVALNDNRIHLFNPTTPTQSRIDIKNDN